jgi:hypothetical protein
MTGVISKKSLAFLNVSCAAGPFEGRRRRGTRAAVFL